MLTSGTKLGPYEILSPLGAGGMGEVYRATDSRLGRDVALKVLPAETAHDPERLARFEREARAVAAINHPHIVTIFSVEEVGGVRFLTMELVEGRSLAELIPEGGLPLERLVEIGGSLAEALAAAHEKGIMHRDLKPANVMMTSDGRVKVLDFGLAKETRADPGDATASLANTQAGVVMGTPAYMSPEQLLGRALDARTDIFSLGVMLHEMATGRRPFNGDCSAELTSAILRDTPPLVTDLRADLPGDLARVIRRCLEKDPGKRIQTARDVSNEFRDLAPLASRTAPALSSASHAVAVPGSGAARAAEDFWIAVLLFRCQGTEAGLEALAEGITEGIITGLSRFSYLRVIAQGSTAKYSDGPGDVRAIGKELGARYVVEGSIRQAGSNCRLAVQLVDAVNGTHLWAETFDRVFRPEEIFSLQDQLVPRIVSTVADQHGILVHSMMNLIRTKGDEQLSPLEAVLRAFSFHERMTPEEHARVRAVLERTVEQAPDEADCWAMLATLYSDEHMFDFSGQPDPLGRAQAAARRAVGINPSSPLASQALAQSLFFRREWQAFRPVAERTIALNPMDGATGAFMGLLLALSGEWERGCAVVESVMQLNPHFPGWYWLGPVFKAYHERDYRASADFTLRINMPGYFWGPATSAAAFGQLGELEMAQKSLKELLSIRPDFAAKAREEFSKWFDPELVEHYVDGLRKAGLDVPRAEGTESPTPAISPPLAKEGSGAARAAEAFWVAVLPFRTPGGDADLEALADGLTEDVTSGLSRFPYLQVIAHNSAMSFGGRAADIRTVGRELGARYVLEGSVRKRGRAVRVSAQLLDTASGTQLWAEAYDRETGNASPFEIQDDLTDHIVTAVADGHGVLVRSMAAPTRDKNVEDLSASELVLRYYAFMQQVDPGEHAVLRAGLERALEREPNHATAWACLSDVYLWEYLDRFNPREKPMERAREAAWRSVKIDPACQMGWKQLAEVYFFSHDFSAFRETAERAMSLNPRDGTTSALMAIMIAYSGDWERGAALAQRTMELNRHHPGWYHLAVVHHQYRKGEYDAALQTAKKINMPEFHWAQLMTAAACGMLGRREEAHAAIELLRKYNPTFLDLDNVRDDIEKWLADKDAVEQLLHGLQKAGLNFGRAGSEAVLDPKSEGSRAPAAVSDSVIGQELRIESGEVRAAEGFWVALLPFKYSGSNADLKTLAEGLTEEIITGLSRFSYLRVIAQSSTAKYSGGSGDVRAIGKELGARYVMEGSIRQVGSNCRLAVQLVDASTGAHLWAETFDRAFRPEEIFTLQDDLVPRIVSTIADTYGVLPHIMSEALRNRDPEKLTPYEAVLRSFAHFPRLAAEEHAAARAGLEHAVQQTPGYADAWAMLSMLYREEYTHRFNVKPDPIGRAHTAALRAVEAAPSNHLAYHALASAQFFRREFQAFRNSAERAIALNPLDGFTVAYVGFLIAYAGDWERGCGLAERARSLNPHHPGWYWFPHFFNAYRKGAYHAALDFALKVNMPGFWRTNFALAAVYGQLGEKEPAAKALQDLLAIRPDFPSTAREELGKWWDPELVEHLIDGLRKAGLEIACEAGVARKEHQSEAQRWEDHAGSSLSR